MLEKFCWKKISSIFSRGPEDLLILSNNGRKNDFNGEETVNKKKDKSNKYPKTFYLNINKHKFKVTLFKNVLMRIGWLYDKGYYKKWEKKAE